MYDPFMELDQYEEENPPLDFIDYGAPYPRRTTTNRKTPKSKQPRRKTTRRKLQEAVELEVA